MKRILGAVLAAVLSIGVIGAAPVAASPLCGANIPQFTAYDLDNEQNTLGFACAVNDQGFDSNFGDASGAFQGTDDNKLNSWRFWNSDTTTWCLVIYNSANQQGALAHYTLPPGGPYVLATGSVAPQQNRTTSVRFWRKIIGNC